MTYCPKCGRKNPDGAVVCAYCGANIAGEKKIPEWESIDDTREYKEKVERTKKKDNFLKIVGVIGLAKYDIHINYNKIVDGRDNGGEKQLILGYNSAETTYWTENYVPHGLEEEMAHFLGAFQSAVTNQYKLDVDVMLVSVGDTQGNAVGMWYCYTDWIIDHDKGIITTEELYGKIEREMTLFR